MKTTKHESDAIMSFLSMSSKGGLRSGECNQALADATKDIIDKGEEIRAQRRHDREMQIKVFTATHLNKLPSDVFEAAKEDGAAVIEHSRYRKGVFAIVWNPDMCEEEALKQAKECI